MDRKLQKRFIAADVASILVFRNLVHVVRAQYKGCLVTTVVYILHYILDGLDGHAQLSIILAVEGVQQILVIWYYLPVVNLL